LRECDGGLTEGLERRRGPGDTRALDLLDLLEECEVYLLCVKERRLKLLVPLLQTLDLQALPLARRLGGTAVAEDALNTSLFLFVLGLGAFPWREVGLWLRKYLTPRLPLLDLLPLRFRGAIRRGRRWSQSGLCERGQAGKHGQVGLAAIGDGLGRHGLERVDRRRRRAGAKQRRIHLVGGRK